MAAAEGMSVSVRMQRTSGTGSAAFQYLDSRTRIATLFQEGAAKIRLPRVYTGTHVEAVTINTAGGLTGGDRMAWSFEAGLNASVVITTQACEKIYRSQSGSASVSTDLTARSGSAIAWIPQETILFDQSALERTLRVDLAEDAVALLVEPVVFGRQAMGEVVKHGFLTDRWRVSSGGLPIHAEDTRFEGPLNKILARPAIAGGKIALATLLLVHPDADILLDRVRSFVGDRGGASAWRVNGRNKLAARFVAESALDLRRQLIPVIELCNAFITGKGRGNLPRVWNI